LKQIRKTVLDCLCRGRPGPDGQWQPRFMEAEKLLESSCKSACGEERVQL
jgi:hypothetical protein